MGVPKPTGARPWADSPPRSESHPIALSAQLGSTLLRLRKALGLSQEVVAERARLSRVFVSQVERGQKRVTLETMQALGEALGLSFWQLAREMQAHDAPADPAS